MRSIITLSLAAACVAAAAPRRAAAQPVADPVGDFLSTYTGPHNADLDITSAAFEFDGASTFRVASTSAGAIGTTPGAVYVWGFNRGDGRSSFASLGLPNIKFDAVAALVPGGQSFFLDLVSGQRTTLEPGAVRASGNALKGFLSLGLLSSQGFSPAAYTANIWPRSAAVFSDNGVISDFAPDDRNVGVSVTPEPATLALVGGGLLALGAAARRRRRPGA